MACLNLDLDYFDHPKTRRLMGLLGGGAEVLPIRLWCYCGRYHVDTGELTGYSVKEIESILSWRGNPGDAVQALLKVRFLEKRANGSYYVHEWLDHNGHIRAFKERGIQAARKRWGLNEPTSSIATSIAKVDSKQYPNQPTNQPTIPTIPEQAIPKSLDTVEFREAFSTWVQIRRLLPIQQDALLKNLLRFGSADAAVRVRQAITGDWLNVSLEDAKHDKVSGKGKSVTHTQFRTCEEHKEHGQYLSSLVLCPKCYPENKALGESPAAKEAFATIKKMTESVNAQKEIEDFRCPHCLRKHSPNFICPEKAQKVSTP